MDSFEKPRSVVELQPASNSLQRWLIMLSFVKLTKQLAFLDTDCIYLSLVEGLDGVFCPVTRFGIFPTFQPQPLSTLTTFGVTAMVAGIRKKMKDLCIA